MKYFGKFYLFYRINNLISMNCKRKKISKKFQKKPILQIYRFQNFKKINVFTDF